MIIDHTLASLLRAEEENCVDEKISGIVEYSEWNNWGKEKPRDYTKHSGINVTALLSPVSFLARYRTHPEVQFDSFIRFKQGKMIRNFFRFPYENNINIWSSK